MQKAITFPALAPNSYRLIIGAGMMLMAIEPIRWLVTSWFNPAYDSKGLWVFALSATLFGWSFSSARKFHAGRTQKTAFILLALTTLVRGLGQVLAINVVGALALVIDVYAIGLLAGLKDRKQAVSPGWLALLFAFSLPLERILQRVAGFGLQQISASGACSVLEGIFPDTACNGVRILIEGHDVLVDLPCSGARMLVLLCIFYAALMALLRPTLRRALAVGMALLVSALAANILRIVLLAVLVAHPVSGIDAMVQPWHDIIGLVFLALAALPVVLLAGSAPAPRRSRRNSAPTAPAKTPQAMPALLFLAAAAIIVALPRKPVDVAVAPAAISLPVSIDGTYGMPVLLSEREKAYFLQFGGSALKVEYGQNSVMMVQTNSPLRHLHAPDECLRGMGYDVRYTGMRYDPLPTATYIAEGPDGAQWRIAVTFYADRDHTASNVAEAVWRWMQHPGTTWHAIQRITPASLPDADARRWDDAVFAALDLTPRHSQEIAYAKFH
ncbi:MAG: exosortase T [Alphaproteobacteria bacterium]|nr:MAG: exosortase T [Alphaproteobacteria bacterium]